MILFKKQFMVSVTMADGASLAVCLHQVYVKILKGGSEY